MIKRISFVLLAFNAYVVLAAGMLRTFFWMALPEGAETPLTWVQCLSAGYAIALIGVITFLPILVQVAREKF